MSEIRPKPSRHSTAALTRLKDALEDAGYPVRTIPRAKRNPRVVMLGPLRIEATASVRDDRAMGEHKDNMCPGEGQAFALIMAAHRGPEGVPGQVRMSWESFVQIVTWLLQGDPSNFMRAERPSTRKDHDVE